MMQEVEVLKTIPELVCSYFSEEQFTLSIARICLTKWAFTVIIWAVCVLCILFVCDFSGTVLLSHDVLILKKEVF